MQKILITGVAGFIGSNLARKLLESGHAVSGIDNLSSGTLENVPRGVHFHSGDIRSQEIQPLFEGVEVVFHLAAKTNLPDCLREPVAASDVNVTGTANVLEAARRAKVRKLIYADTSAEYEGIDEFPSPVGRVRPLGCYAVSKQGGAIFCEFYHRFFHMDITTVRYFNVYGPVQDWRRVFPPVMSSFTTKLLKGQQPIIYGTGQKRRDFIYVDDVNDFHMILLEDRPTSGKVYNVGSGTNYSVLEIFDRIEAKLKTGLQPRFEPDMPGEAEITLADIADSVELGWQPRVSLEEGLDRAIEYYRKKILVAS